MNRFYFFLILLLIIASAKGQQPAATATIPGTMPYGKVDIADLKMTSCDFEKDANAEVLFDKSSVHSGSGLMMERHIRIKIFNDFGKKNANIRMAYRTEFLGSKGVGGIKAETINVDENGAIVITPVERGQIFTEKINHNVSAVVFTFPNVKAGSIIEYKYDTYPPLTWYFQSSLPTRYSEIMFYNIGRSYLMSNNFVKQPFVVQEGGAKSDKNIWAMANIHSLPDEPYMTARRNNLQRIEFKGLSLSLGSWGSIAKELSVYKGFGANLDEKLPGEEAIIKKASELANDEERIAFIFDTVKYSMKWNNEKNLVMTDDIKSAWIKKTGNSAEMNLIVYHLLTESGINASPMVVCSRDFGRIDPFIADIFSLNNTVVYVPVENSVGYVLDASNKFNTYNTIPYSLLDSYGLSVNIPGGNHKMILMQDTLPVLQTLALNAEIQPSGKMVGTAEITSNSYNLVNAVQRYKTAGEEKYLDTLRKLDNNLTISSYKMENASVDAGPLSEKFDFSLNLNSSDDSYIIFSTNLFSQMEDNPFRNENRYSDIDLGYRRNFSMSGVYKIPAGYKIEGLPKSITLIIPDQSIVFKRTVAEDNGSILVRFSVNHKKTIYYEDEYQDLRGFYKKMYELMDEKVILKKM